MPVWVFSLDFPNRSRNDFSTVTLIRRGRSFPLLLYGNFHHVFTSTNVVHNILSEAIYASAEVWRSSSNSSSSGASGATYRGA